jgi:hypothetical protein
LRVLLYKTRKNEHEIQKGYADSLKGVIAFEVGPVLSWQRDDNFSPSEYQLIIKEDHVRLVEGILFDAEMSDTSCARDGRKVNVKNKAKENM